MHLSLIVGAIALAILIRLSWSPAERTSILSWQATVMVFLMPPLLVISTTVAVLYMGTQGQMMGISVGWMGYSCALVLLSFVLGTLAYRAMQGWRSLRRVRTYPLIQVGGQTGRILNTPALFAAQIGFWEPELVVSQGLLESLESAHLDAVLTHERAHVELRDTFWFFWLGWVKQLTGWLPRTNALWHELLLLRELRADAWAARSVDPLVLAEALLQVVRSPLDVRPEGIAFDAATSLSRLDIRIDALLDAVPPHKTPFVLAWLGWTIALLPLFTVLLHS